LNFAIHRKLFRMNIRQAILAGALQNKLRRVIELRGRRDAMQARDISKIFVRCGSTGFVAQRDPLMGV
jgi:hypothetical protein